MPKDITSKYIEVRESKIHNKGIFAACKIRKGTKIIQYVGDKVTKAESDIRAEMVFSEYENDITKGAVYIFELDETHDIDGNVDWNTARYINHSCDPNCETVIYDDEIWIVALRTIQEGEELSYNYGYSFEDYQDHKCLCGSQNCVGYILDEDHWPRLKKKLDNRGEEAFV